ncbi:MAG: hypothetical protein GF328_05455, partial [Candidatus Latescibacteria bacterium]|nr:hypothetical protein [Candidatus Latescibacterota bacterium]
MIRRIDWLRLDLEGFGVWREPTRFHFPDRLGLFRLPNERGKSTLVAGLRACLFGLPNKTDPRDHGIARYRSWGQPRPCRGVLEARLDDRRILFRRDFVSHDTRVDVVDDAGGSLESLFSGQANPEGRNPSTRAYEVLLRDLLGELADEELFAATFLVEQPVVPAGETDEALGRLVSGVGRVGGDEACARLFEEVKSLTRFTGDRELLAPESTRPTNQRTDGAIEQRKKELEALEATRVETVARFDALVDLEDRRDRAEARSAQAEEELRHAAADLERIET